MEEVPALRRGNAQLEAHILLTHGTGSPASLGEPLQARGPAFSDLVSEISTMLTTSRAYLSLTLPGELARGPAITSWSSCSRPDTVSATACLMLTARCRDDDEAWRSTIQRQKDAEDRLSRRKEDADRDAALARQLAGRSSPSPSGPRFAEPSRLGQNNAFTRILGRSPLGLRRPSHVKPEPGNIKSEPGHVESELSPTLPSRPRVPVKAEPGSFAGPSWNMAETEQNQYHVPGAWEDIDSEAYGARGPGRVLGGRSRPSLPSVPQLPSSYNHPANTPAGFGTNSSLRYIPNVPAIELARQSSMARQETPSSAMSPGWLPLGPVGQRLQSAAQFACPPVMGQTLPSSPSFGTDRPGFGSELATTIGRVNGYDFNAMLDAEGNQLNSRLVGLLDDYVNDPRKTEEDIQQLLSNIRPDMEIPQEERGETPESLKYPLYTHQQLALKWMSEMEEGTNKGGILADDMGLGKTISTLALMVSRPPLDNVKVYICLVESVESYLF